MSTLTLVLGAPDPEMTAIEELGRRVGAEICYALSARGGRVRADEAYQVAALDAPLPPGTTVYAVECDGPAIPTDAIRIDHHRPGDPGYGRPPAEFMPASSLGQVLAAINGGTWHWWPGDGYAAPTWRLVCDGDVAVTLLYGPSNRPEIVLAAAADHCLAAAYRGECPGVDPDALMRWRVEQRAAFQRRAVEDVLADVERARELLEDVPNERLAHGVYVADMRGYGHVPELPEAALREGVAYLTIVTGRDGRRKVVLSGHTDPETVRAFMTTWAPAQGLTDIYGVPARGFAGGYLAEAVR